MDSTKIAPITRLAGQDCIDLFLNADGELESVRLAAPEPWGFEDFCVGRPVEELPRIASRVCGACAPAQHLAAAKAGDAVYQVQPPPTAHKLRELLLTTAFVADHAAHFCHQAGPDLGAEARAKAKKLLQDNHAAAAIVGGRPVHAVSALVGGVSKTLASQERDELLQTAQSSVETARSLLQVFEDVTLKDQAYADLLQGEALTHQTYYMGLVDEQNRVNFYDGQVRVVGPGGDEFARYSPGEYQDALAGLELVCRAGPLARLNAAAGIATPLAQAAYERFHAALGQPAHQTLATHWARLIELLYAAERTLELAEAPDIAGSDIRTIPSATPTEGVGSVESPNGTLTHHYATDERGLLTGVNLVLGTDNNCAALEMSITKAAQGLVKAGAELSDAALNQIELVLRAYAPCCGCATHTLPGRPVFKVRLFDQDGELVQEARWE